METNPKDEFSELEAALRKLCPDTPLANISKAARTLIGRDIAQERAKSPCTELEITQHGTPTSIDHIISISGTSQIDTYETALRIGERLTLGKMCVFRVYNAPEWNGAFESALVLGSKWFGFSEPEVSEAWRHFGAEKWVTITTDMLDEVQAGRRPLPKLAVLVSDTNPSCK